MTQQITIPLYMWKENEVVISLLKRENAAASDTIKTLIRERDEARARADGLEKLVKLYGLLDDGSPVERAEARGYERGLKEAIAAGDRYVGDWSDPHWTLTRAAILALLEPVTLQEPEA